MPHFGPKSVTCEKVSPTPSVNCWAPDSCVTGEFLSRVIYLCFCGAIIICVVSKSCNIYLWASAILYCTKTQTRTQWDGTGSFDAQLRVWFTSSQRQTSSHYHFFHSRNLIYFWPNWYPWLGVSWPCCWDVRFGSKVGQIGPKLDKSGTFSDQIMLHNCHIVIISTYINTKMCVCVFAFFSAIWNPIGIRFGTK